MVDKPVRPGPSPEEDHSYDTLRVDIERGHMPSPAGRNLAIASLAFTVSSSALIFLVVVNEMAILPALLLFLLALIAIPLIASRSNASVRGKNRFGSLPIGEIPPADLHGLLEIERTTVAEERRVLIARELSRLASEALRPDPTQRATWPTPEQFAALRNQIALLCSSAADPRARQLPVGSPVGHLSDSDLSTTIQALDAYVNHLYRMQSLGIDNREQTRVLVRDQSCLRLMQDKIVGQLQEPALTPPSELLG